MLGASQDCWTDPGSQHHGPSQLQGAGGGVPERACRGLPNAVGRRPSQLQGRWRPWFFEASQLGNIYGRHAALGICNECFCGKAFRIV